MSGLEGLKISEEKKKYIVEELNPLLEELVADVLSSTPDDPILHMRDFLRAKKIKRDEDQLSPEERERVLKETDQMKEELTRMTEALEKIQGVSAQAAPSEQKSEIASESKAADANHKQADSDVAAETAAESLDAQHVPETVATEPVAKSDSEVAAEPVAESLVAKNV